jgi:hypothetical protein
MLLVDLQANIPEDAEMNLAQNRETLAFASRVYFLRGVEELVEEGSGALSLYKLLLEAI